jgi:dihydrofolate reductase
MRKILLLEHVTLDGYVAGPNGEMDWVHLPDEIWHFGDRLTATSDAAIYGRVTYDMMAGYWPTAADGPDADRHAIDHAKWVNNTQRYVVSKTLQSAPWGNSSCTVLPGDPTEEIARLKQQPGRNIFLVGSISLAQALMRAGLIDEYHLMLNPVILGGGRSLFPAGLPQHLNLQLVSQQALPTGVIALHYEPS